MEQKIDTHGTSSKLFNYNISTYISWHISVYQKRFYHLPESFHKDISKKKILHILYIYSCTIMIKVYIF
uniref:Uncharacterized protein n=1 Tax=Strongyloides papillosus TaxID=174720 RepID=A0A0N5BIX3_STREA